MHKSPQGKNIAAAMIPEAGRFRSLRDNGRDTLTQSAILRSLDVSRPSALCLKFVGGRVSNAWFAGCGIKEKRGRL